MVEPEGTPHDGTKPSEIFPTKFRFIVSDVLLDSDRFRTEGVHVEVIHRE